MVLRLCGRWAFSLLLRLGGIFQKPLAAAVLGTLLCICTLGVFVSAVVLANNDRLAGDRAKRTDVSDSFELDNTTTTQANEEKEALGATGLQSVIEGCSSPDSECVPRLEEEPNPPQETGEEESAYSWLALVAGGTLCLEDPLHEEAS